MPIQNAIQAINYYSDILNDEDAEKAGVSKRNQQRELYINEYDLRKILTQHLQTTEDCDKNIIDVFILELKDTIEPDYVSNYFRRFKIEGSGNIRSQLLSIKSRGGLSKGDNSLKHGGTQNFDRTSYDNFTKTLNELDSQSFDERDQTEFSQP